MCIRDSYLCIASGSDLENCGNPTLHSADVDGDCTVEQFREDLCYPGFIKSKKWLDCVK